MYLWWEQRYPVGTKLRVLSSPVHHEGTYVGHVGQNGEDVIHSDKPDGVILSHFEEFAEHWPVQVISTPSSPEEGQAIVERAIQTLGVRYDLLGVNGLNCEQAANYHQRGEPVSPTLRFLGGAALVVGAIIFFGRGA